MGQKALIRAELRRIQAAIADLEGGAQSATISSNGGTHSYTKLTMSELTDRETVLLGRLSRADIRKRTAPDFT